jgi:hypothetical protein
MIAESHPEVRLLGPCSFQATRITRHSFSIVYLNPPFDDEFGGGGREEVSLLRQAVDLLVQVYGRWEMCELIDTWFQDVELFLFPDDFRRFNECVVFGRRRKTALPEVQIRTQGVLTSRDIRDCSAAPIPQLARLGETQFRRWDNGWPDAASRKTDLDIWELPFSTAPERFQKTALTEEELERELARSPLYESLRQRVLLPIKRPPLSLNKGQLRATGRSLDQIRQYLNYQMKARTRMGGEWPTGRIGFLVQQGLRLLGETEADSTEPILGSVDAEEKYDNLIHLEDECDD